MRRSSYFSKGLLALLMVSGLLSAVDAVAVEGVQNLMTSYFEALKNGNVKELAAMLADPLLESKKLLLERNPAYPAHLKKYYKDAVLRVIDISQAETDTQTVTAEIIFPNDDRPLKSRFTIKYKETGWKIAHESIAP